MMRSPTPPTTSGPLRSSMESFLDEYQLVRMAIGTAGLAFIGIVVVAGQWNQRLNPIVGVLLVVTIHAIWSRWTSVRSPRVMLLLDLTLWGWVMSLPADKPSVATASFAFLTLLTVLFADGYWIVLLLSYVSAWYGYAFFSERPAASESLTEFIAVVITMACMAVVVYYVRRWLGRLDANRSQMMGTVSHELRNNLTGMIGVTDLIIDSADVMSEQLRELVSLANQQAVDAAEIVEDLLTASRLEGSALDVGAEAVDLDAEVTTVVRRFAGEGTDVTVQAEGGLPEARADALRVRQILRNLISNAVRYGGPTITVSTRRTVDRLEVVVGDDGDGVSHDAESTIFLPYQRSTVTPRHASSVGLGLWICRQLADAMGGSLEYRRRPNVTEFVLLLPLDVPDETDAAVEGARSKRAPALLGDDRMMPAVTIS